MSTDYLLKDDMELMEASLPEEESGNSRMVSMEEASSFLSYREMASGRISIGVMMCILSPVLLIVLSGLQDSGWLSIPATVAVGLGLIVLLLLVGGAVAIFVTTGLQGQRFEYLENETIDTAYGVDGMVKDRREKYRSYFTSHLVVGIVLCVLSAIPIFVALLVFGENNTAITIAVAVLLVMVAIGRWPAFSTE